MHRVLSEEQRQILIQKLKERFEENMHRHEHVSWNTVEKQLKANPEKLYALYMMEETSGEPDVVSTGSTSQITFIDCSAESPEDRRSLCYDKEAWESRKANKPIGNAVDAAKSMYIELLTEEDYQLLQSVGDFDLKTSSWLLTPNNVREKGGSIFGDKRYGRTFTYHNGAESYYAARGFRGKVSI